MDEGDGKAKWEGEWLGGLSPLLPYLHFPLFPIPKSLSFPLLILAYSAKMVVTSAITCKRDLRMPSSQASAGRAGVGGGGLCPGIPAGMLFAPWQTGPCISSSLVLGAVQ